MTNRKANRGLFYSRDSGGHHEMTPSQYVKWAIDKSAELGVTFEAEAADIDKMVRSGLCEYRNLFFDYGVRGNVLDRPALNSLIRTATDDNSASHIFIPRRDRFARPDEASQGVALETALRRLGLTLVFMDRICQPLSRGSRQDIGDLLVSTLDYDRSGQDRRDLAQKVIYAKIGLAQRGFSTGGRPPYGFRRWLVNESGVPIRQLEPGERIRMAGHHVVWLPGPDEELAVILRILSMLEHMPAGRVATLLTEEGVPTPDSGRCRTDNGVKHTNNGIWHRGVITAIAQHPLLRSIVEYGRRGMGDQLRSTPNGPRELEDHDFRSDVDKPKVVTNPEDQRIRVQAQFAPLVDPEIHQRLLSDLKQRGGTQRGKPRSRSLANNPLGCRIFDAGCGWPMYRASAGGKFRYRCGLYLQSHGRQCEHNWVDGPQAAGFALNCLRQRLLTPRRLNRIQSRLRELARQDSKDHSVSSRLHEKRSEISRLEAEIERIGGNLARAESGEQYRAIAVEFDRSKDRLSAITQELQLLEQQSTAASRPERGVEMSLEIIRRLPELEAAANDFLQLRQLFELVNLRMFVRFQKVKQKKRTLNKVAGGVVTFGSTEPPVTIYEGTTSTRDLKSGGGQVAIGGNDSRPHAQETSSSGLEDSSLRNASRGGQIRTDDFLLPKQAL